MAVWAFSGVFLKIKKCGEGVGGGVEESETFEVLKDVEAIEESETFEVLKDVEATNTTKRSHGLLFMFRCCLARFVFLPVWVFFFPISLQETKKEQGKYAKMQRNSRVSKNSRI